MTWREYLIFCAGYVIITALVEAVKWVGGVIYRRIG